MLDFLMRTQEVPARYKLEFNDASASLKLYVHPGVLEHIGDRLYAHGAKVLASINKHCDHLETPHLVWNPAGDMGCGKVMLYHGERDGWRIWHIPLSMILAAKQTPHDWSKGFAISISLRTIFDWAQDENMPASDHENQMICYKMAAENRIYGGAISARLSMQAHGLLKILDRSAKERILDQIFESLRCAWEAMDAEPLWKKQRAERERVYALNSAFTLWYPEHGGIIINVPGNATGVGPVPTNMHPEDQSIELEPHNTDTPIQQLTLLAGLAKLEMFLREKLTTP